MDPAVTKSTGRLHIHLDQVILSGGQDLEDLGSAHGYTVKQRDG